MDQVYYACSGPCGGEVSEDEYKNGKKTCQTDSCPMKGKEFEKRFKCGKCGQTYKEGELHAHVAQLD